MNFSYLRLVIQNLDNSNDEILKIVSNISKGHLHEKPVFMKLAKTMLNIRNELFNESKDNLSLTTKNSIYTNESEHKEIINNFNSSTIQVDNAEAVDEHSIKTEEYYKMNSIEEVCGANNVLEKIQMFENKCKKELASHLCDLKVSSMNMFNIKNELPKHEKTTCDVLNNVEESSSSIIENNAIIERLFDDNLSESLELNNIECSLSQKSSYYEIDVMEKKSIDDKIEIIEQKNENNFIDANNVTTLIFDEETKIIDKKNKEINESKNIEVESQFNDREININDFFKIYDSLNSTKVEDAFLKTETTISYVKPKNHSNELINFNMNNYNYNESEENKTFANVISDHDSTIIVSNEDLIAHENINEADIKINMYNNTSTNDNFDYKIGKKFGLYDDRNTVCCIKSELKESNFLETQLEVSDYIEFNERKINILDLDLSLIEVDSEDKLLENKKEKRVRFCLEKNIIVYIESCISDSDTHEEDDESQLKNVENANLKEIEKNAVISDSKLFKFNADQKMSGFIDKDILIESKSYSNVRDNIMQ